MDKMLTVVIPAYNEEAALPLLLPSLISFCHERHYQILVVNDGSTDNTAGVLAGFAQRGEIRLITHKLNRGYGGAIKTGIQATETEFMITIDADGQHRLEDIEILHTKIVESDADMVVGSRKGLKSASVFREIGKWLIRNTASLLMPLPIYDLNSGMKIYRTELAQRYMPLYPDNMSFSDIVVLAFVNQRQLVLEHPITVQPRVAGLSTIGIETAFQTLREILNIIVLFNPMKVFFPAALVLGLGGAFWGVPILLHGRGVSVGASLLIITAVLLLFLGLMAEQLSAIRMADIRQPTSRRPGQDSGQ